MFVNQLLIFKIFNKVIQCTHTSTALIKQFLTNPISYDLLPLRKYPKHILEAEIQKGGGVADITRK